jgi:glycerol uptake facilitator-like aquaporin
VSAPPRLRLIGFLGGSGCGIGRPAVPLFCLFLEISFSPQAFLNFILFHFIGWVVGAGYFVAVILPKLAAHSEYFASFQFCPCVFLTLSKFLSAFYWELYANFCSWTMIPEKVKFLSFSIEKQRLLFNLLLGFLPLVTIIGYCGPRYFEFELFMYK